MLAKNGVDAEKISRLIDELVAPDEEVKVSTRPEPESEIPVPFEEQRAGVWQTAYRICRNGASAAGNDPGC